MKKGIFILLALTLAAFMSLPAWADQGGRGHSYRQSSRDRRGNQDRAQAYDKRGRDRDYDYRKPEHRPPGYHVRPHGRRFSQSHMRRGREYRYDGHWNSYSDWDRYRKRYPERFHRGRYYREGSHLFFNFCDPLGGACFYFSIGR